MHHSALNRAWTDDGDLDHQVEITTRFEPRQHRHLRPRLHLEHAHRLAFAQHVVRGRILRGNVLHAELPSFELALELQRPPDRRHHAQRQAVDLQQAQRIQIVLVPLNDGAIRHRGILDRYQCRQRLLRHHEAAHVLRQVPRKTQQLRDQAHQLLGDARLRIESQLCELCWNLSCGIEPLQRAGQCLHEVQLQAQRPGHIPDRHPAPISDDGRSEGRSMPPVLFVHMLDHLLAALMLEINIDIGGLMPLLGNESLQQEVHPPGVDFRHAQ